MQTAAQARAPRPNTPAVGVGQQRFNMIEVISIIGSLASVIGLGIVILQEATKQHEIRYSQLGWRISLVAVALVAASGSLLFSFVWSRDAYHNKNYSESWRILVVTTRAVIGLVLFGVCLDGLFASIYWTYWLSAPADFITDDVIGWLHRVISR